jgi:hypothetical protein
LYYYIYRTGKQRKRELICLGVCTVFHADPVACVFVFFGGNHQFPYRKIYFLLRKCAVSLQEKLFSSEEVLSFLTGKFIFLGGSYQFPYRKIYFPRRKLSVSLQENLFSSEEVCGSPGRNRRSVESSPGSP